VTRRLLALVFVLGAVLHTSGAEAERAPGWTLDIPERVELVAGTGGTLPITLSVDRGQSISKDAGIILDLAPDSAIAIKRRRLGRADAVDPGAESPRFAIALRSETAGDFTIRVRIRFWLCGTKVCRPVEARRNVTVPVAVPAQAPPPAPAAP
jgi:hypothetical protein